MHDFKNSFLKFLTFLLQQLFLSNIFKVYITIFGKGLNLNLNVFKENR